MLLRLQWKRILGVLIIAILALLIHGYHYGIEDEAIYLPAVKQHLNGALYPFDSAFFDSQSRLTLFDEFMAVLCRVTHLPPDWVFFSVYCLSTFLFVLVLRQLAERFFRDARARWASVLLPSALLTVPVAGTALFIMDQHLHPRNLSTIALLFALVAVLDKRRVTALVWVALAAAFHPLMALYGASLLSMFAWRTLRLHFLGFALFLPFAWFLLPPASAAWRQAIEPYYFLSEWAWYEWVGILGPLVLLMACGRWAASRELPLISFGTRTLVLFGVFYFLVAATVTFVHRFAQLAPLQPMRSLQLIYLFLFFFAGGIAGQTYGRHWGFASVLFLALCAGMHYAQRQEFPASPHIELPGRVPHNSWMLAFDWIRRNAPMRAYFVMHPRYLERPGEDFHGFRALAERSVLADQIKDRSVATVYPGLAQEWLEQSEAQRNWSSFGPADLHRLKQRFGVDWALLERAIPPFSGDMVCPYQNDQIQVCRID
ncbi:MAG: hypothetical protein ABSD56_07815 [Bryobacteraceae bacterium]